MIRNCLNILWASLAAVILCVGCSDVLPAEVSGGNELSLRISSEMIQTKTIDGVNALNENRMKTLDIFMYPSSAGDDAEATLHFQVAPDVNSSYTVVRSFSDDEIDDLFGTDATAGTCRVYVIANIGEGGATVSGTSINALKQLTVASVSTVGGSSVNSFADTEKEDSFVMDSDATDIVTLSTDANGSKSLSGTVELYRSAAKVILYVNVAEMVTDNGTTWTSLPSDMKVTFHNGVSKGYLGNDRYTYGPVADDYFSVKDVDFNDTSVEMAFDGDEGTQTLPFYTTPIPFYSYPTSWTGDEDNVYMTLVVPWKKDGATVYDHCSYQVPVNYNGKALDRNTCYQLLLRVGILGAFDESETVTISPSYVLVEAAQWGYEAIAAEMKENVYLVVDQTDVVMSNVETISIGYTSSHAISAVITEITQPDLSSAVVSTTTYYSNDTGTASVAAGTNGLLNTCSVSVSEDGQILLDHVIVNRDEVSSAEEDFDLTPYYITVKVTMTTGTQTYTEYITIVQYPAIYMEASLNSDHATGTSGSSNKGYVIVNGNNDAEGGGGGGNNSSSLTFGTSPVTTTSTGYEEEDVQWLGQVYGDIGNPGDDNAGTRNPNMYVLTLSSFQNNDYLIGDPRTTTYEDVFQIYANDYSTTVSGEVADSDGDSFWDNTYYMKMSASNYVWARADARYDNPDGGRRLMYYYPTDESENTQNVIAPKIRFASSHSIPSPVVKSKEMAKRRCAAYQEDGYPAGRWRLPTKAEVKFTLELNQAGKIPHVFSTSLAYWSAHGYFSGDVNNMTFSEVTTTSGQGSVRCVYDEWYWNDGQIEDKTKFVWGDMPR